MMSVEEGNGLLHAVPQANIELVENCINNPKPRLPLLIALCLAMGNAADAVEIMCIGFIMTDMGDISSTKKELLSSAVFMGMLVGGVVCGYLSDIVGRRPCLLYSLGLNAIAGFISAASPNIEMLIVCRVIGGLGIGGSVPVVFSLGAEVFPKDRRGQYLSVIASFWMMGAIYTAFFAWIMLGEDYNGNKMMPGVNWHWFAAVSALPALAAFLLTLYWIPESPRYLLNEGLVVEAREVLCYLSTVQVEVEDLEYIDSKSPTINSPSSQTSKIRSSSSPRKNGGGGGSAVSLTKATSTLSVLFSGTVRTNTIVLMVIWFTLCFGTYGISTWISTLFADVGLSNPYSDAFIFAMANLPGNLVSIFLIEVVGRRSLLAYGMCLAGISALGFALDTHDAVVVVLCASLFNAFSVIGWNSLDCMSVEYFPTPVRTSAMGVLAATGRIGAIAAQFVNGSLEGNIPLLLFVTSGCTVVGGLAAWLLPHDSTGTTLAESVKGMSTVGSVDDSMPDVSVNGSESEHNGSSSSGGGGVGGSTTSVLHRGTNGTSGTYSKVNNYAA